MSVAMEKQAGASCLDRYGNILNVDTTGASEATAKPEGLSYAGVPASEKIAEKDLKNMEKYQAKITQAGNSKCVDPAVIAGIISRESHAGTVLKDGWGDHGNAFGLMQVDKRYHKIVGSWDSEEHLAQGTEILCGMIKEIQRKFPSWTKEQQLKATILATLKKEHINFENVWSSLEETLYSGAPITAEAVVVGSLYSNYNTNMPEVINVGGISAYNAGANNVQSYDRMDIGTTHNDYANDVVARAKFYKRNGY